MSASAKPPVPPPPPTSLPRGELQRAQQVQSAAPPGSVPSNFAIGILVHLYIQAHYLLTHPNNTILLDSWFCWDGMLRRTVSDMGKTTGDGRFGAILFALVQKFMNIPKRPDIMDYTTGEIYEIKPRRRAVAGVLQLYRRYLDPINDIFSRLEESPPVEFKPGTSWKPNRVYPVPPNRAAVATRPLDGLIIYDVYETKGGLSEAQLSAPIVAFFVLSAAVELIPEATVGMEEELARRAVREGLRRIIRTPPHRFPPMPPRLPPGGGPTLPLQ